MTCTPDPNQADECRAFHSVVMVGEITELGRKTGRGARNIRIEVSFILNACGCSGPPQPWARSARLTGTQERNLIVLPVSP